MDTSRLAVAAALVGLVTAGPAVAQQSRPGGPYPAQANAQEASVDFDGGQSQPPAIAQPPAARPPATHPRKNGDFIGPGAISASYAKKKKSNSLAAANRPPPKKKPVARKRKKRKKKNHVGNAAPVPWAAGATAAAWPNWASPSSSATTSAG